MTRLRALGAKLAKLTSQVVNTTYFLLTLRTIVAVIIAFFINKLSLDAFEAFLYDFRVAAKPSRAISPNIELIYIDNETVDHLRSQPHWKHLSSVLALVAQDSPHTVILDLEASSVLGNEADKAQFSSIAKGLSHFYFATSQLVVKGEENKLRLAPPLHELRAISAPMATDKNVYAKDGVTRRMALTFQDQLLLHPYVASTLVPEVAIPDKVRGSFEEVDSAQTYIDYAPAGSYPEASFLSLLRGSKQRDYKNKIVIIGNNLLSSSAEYVRTPFSKEVTAMTRVEAHANMIDTLLKNSAPQKTPKWFRYLLSMLISILTVQVVLGLKPLKGILVLLVSLGILSIVSYLAFWWFGLWIELAHSFLAIFICYYFFIPYRLIIENRKNWEFYQEHKLLKQVEELKTNFISMMSHDLKTPIARIQGMTDIILRGKDRLTEEQSDAAQTIKKSSEDLLQFISNILNFSRIESQGIKLNLQAKDINSLIEDCIEKHQFYAHEKSIEIRAELEPLFPIKIDPELIKQVFSNLIENAIKYSPNGSKILISSEERDGLLVVQFADQGAGIPSDEISNIFLKFFRSHQAKSSPIRGSGLGLYLAKYIVDLHKGSISAESTLGQGSTFTVVIPCNL